MASSPTRRYTELKNYGADEALASNSAYGVSWTPKRVIPIESVAQAKETYAPEQPTEQRTTLPETVVEATRDAPASVAQENVAPPEEAIDVIKDYDWTLSINKEQLIQKIPFIRLKEYQITADNAINAIAAGVFAWGDMQKAGMNALGRMSSLAGTGASDAAQASGITSAVNKVGSSVSDAASMMGLDKELAFLQEVKDNKFPKVVTQLGGVLNGSIEKFVKAAKEHVSKVQPTSDFGPEGQHLMDVYGGLYARKATGRSYTLPYYENEYFATSNSFSDTTTIPLVGAVFDKIAKISNFLPALVEPGVYVQRPKYYNFETDGHQFSFSITLYNTITPLAHLKNSKFIQQLILNNLPRRKTRIVVEPPCIYEVLIPGKAFFPYCFITDLRVLHVGTKRLIEGEIVPEAFELQITIKSLVSDTSNFYEKQMQHHGLSFPTPQESYPPNMGTTMGESGAQRDAIAQPPNAEQSMQDINNNTPDGVVRSSENMDELAERSRQLADSNSPLVRGQSRDGAHCWAGVKTSLMKTGLVDKYPETVHAYQAGSDLERNGFSRLNITDPREAPNGSVIVYGRTPTHTSGHIEIKSTDRSGNTKWVSDVSRNNPSSSMPITGIYVKK